MTNRELDALVAEKVMGWSVYVEDGDPYGEFLFAPERRHVPYYSTDIAAAWEVVNRMRLHPDYVSAFELTDNPTNSTAAISETDGKWFAGFCLGNGMECAAGETAPHAICLAALKAVGHSP